MLIKLMKHELKATSRLLVPLYIILACITVVNKILLKFDASGLSALLDVFLTLLYVLSIVSILVVTFVLMIMRFYKNLMTDEGYLMFTLPVKSHDLINAKLFVTFFWTIISVVAVLCSLFIIFAVPANTSIIMENIHQAYIEFHTTFGNSGVFLAIIFILLCLVATINNILSIYASIAIGQLFNGHKIIGSFIAYIASYTAIQVILTIVIGILTLINKNKSFSDSYFVIEVFTVITIVITAITAIFYRITNQILQRKLNLD